MDSKGKIISSKSPEVPKEKPKGEINLSKSQEIPKVKSKGEINISQEIPKEKPKDENNLSKSSEIPKVKSKGEINPFNSPEILKVKSKGEINPSKNESLEIIFEEEKAMFSMKKTVENFIDSERIKNRGTGAGGAKTNENGLKFEENINSEIKKILVQQLGFIEHIIKDGKNIDKYYFQKEYDDKEIIYTFQKGFKLYMNKTYGNKDDIFRDPDDIFIIVNKKTREITVIVLEIKSQQTPGSVDVKLMACRGFKRDYEYMFNIAKNRVKIHYAFCVNDYIRKTLITPNKPKCNCLREYLEEENVPVFFGEDKDFLERFFDWLNSFL